MFIRDRPISFAQRLVAYAAMFRRDVTRLEDCAERLNECPLGSGALAGTTYPIDRHQTAKALGFEAPMGNSLDGVSDRDYALELLSALSILMMHLSRFSEEIILWCSWEFKFIELDDGYATGSSIMPQKKNPDVAEPVSYTHLSAAVCKKRTAHTSTLAQSLRQLGRRFCVE